MKSQVWIGKKRLKKPLIQGGMGIESACPDWRGQWRRKGEPEPFRPRRSAFLQPEFEQNPVLANLKAMEEELQKGEKDCTGWHPRV